VRQLLANTTSDDNRQVQELGTWLATIAQRERALLAPFAQHTLDSAGRRYPEPTQDYRGAYQRDRDRIIHSAAFRRLSGKMQVFTGEMGDYHRTRLTHTHEVASIARTVARALRLNEDLVEALALFHDIGHPPFGHAGEDALHECVENEGGFSHNRQAIVIATELERRYGDYPGLNLSQEILDGQQTRADKQRKGNAPLLEVQLVDCADSMTYDAHDTDDAVKLGWVSIEELAGLSLIRDALAEVRRRYTNLVGDLQRKALVHQLLDRQVRDLLAVAGAFLADCNWQSTLDVRESSFRMGPSQEVKEQKAELEKFLYREVYRHPRILQVRTEAQTRLKELWQTYCSQPDLLPSHYRSRAEVVGVRRAAVDYLAGMTDRFCLQRHEELIVPARG
jgi:dGTPase